MAESDATIYEVTLLLLEAPKGQHSVEALALVGDRDEGASARQHDFYDDQLGGIAAVAVTGKLYWKRLKTLLRIGKREDEQPG